MSEILKIVSADMAGKRLDAYLAAAIPDLSRNYAEMLIGDRRVTVNGKETLKKYKVKENDRIVINYPEPRKIDVTPENIPLDIVYEDEDVIVVNKPRGMVVHPSAGNYDGTLVNAIMYHCGDSLSSINGAIRPGIVHRIDKNTSGLLMIAKNNRAHESLAEQLRVHSVTREYRALVYDNIREDELTIDVPIGRDERNRLRKAVNGSNPKNAVTHVKVLKRYGKYTLVAARLETGRTHQIRVHLSHIKHPLVGDTTYGPKKQLYGLDGQMLHAKTLGFIHPRTGEYMEFDSELPPYFTDVLDKIERSM
ncbi:MAG: RluA family pseudouridine synthase [Eubacteriales bacterium]|nr:RluA family pseudouridine synthase [Eubacteriales bacterium]